MPRLIDSLRATLSADTSSLLWAVMRLLRMICTKLGTPVASRTASTEMATINSRMVKPLAVAICVRMARVIAARAAALKPNR